MAGNSSVPGFARRKEVVLFLSVLLAATLFAHVYGWNEFTRMDLSRAIVEEQSVAITPYHNNTGDKILFDGAYYSDKPPLSSFIGVPAHLLATMHAPAPHGFYPVGGTDYWGNTLYKPVVPNTLFHLLFTLLTASIPGALLVVLIKRQVDQEYGAGVAAFTAVAFGFGTLLFLYSAVAVGVALAALFAYLSYIYTVNDAAPRRTVLAGVLGGLAVSAEYYAVFIPAILFVHLLVQDRDAAWRYGIGGLVGLSPLILYNAAISGMLPLYLQKSANHYQGGGSATFFRVVGGTLWQQVIGTALSTVVTALKLLVYPVRGLLFYSPLLLLALVGMYTGRDADRADRTTYLPLAILLVYLLFNASLWGWFSGTSYGPRYLIIVIPFLALPFARTVRRLRWRRVAMALLVIGMFHNLVGARGPISAQGDPLTAELGIPPADHPDHAPWTWEAVSTGAWTEKLYPHAWEEYAAHVTAFVTEGPPMMAVTTLLTDTVWEIRLPPVPSDIPVWTTDAGVVVLSGGWLALAALILFIAGRYRKELVALWRDTRSARIAAIIGAAGLLLLPVHIAATAPQDDPWSFRDGSLYLGDAPVALQKTYQPERIGVWVGSEGKLVVWGNGNESALGLHLLPAHLLPSSSVNRSPLHITLNGRTVFNDSLTAEILTVRTPLRDGPNRLMITNTDGCAVFGGDPRCRSVLLRDIRLGNRLVDAGYPYGRWQVPTRLIRSYRPDTSGGVWMGEKGGFLLRPSAEASALILHVQPSNGLGSGIFRFTLDNNTVIERTVSRERLSIPIAGNDRWVQLSIRSRDGCTRSLPEDPRCRSLLIWNVTEAGADATPR